MRSLLVLPLLATGAAAQQVQTRTLAKPTAEYGEPFSQIVAAYELRDGRVVTADPRDKTLLAVDIRGGKTTPIGREGAGPQEWGSIRGISGWLGDSLVAYDGLNSRYLIIDPNAKPVRTFSTAGDLVGTATQAARGGDGGRGSAAGSAGGGAGGRGGDPARGGAGDGRISFGGPGGGPRISGGVGMRGADSRGRIYSQDIGLSLGADGRITSGDSAAIVRFDPATNKRDTIAYVNLAKNSAGGSARGDGRGNQTLEIRVGSSNPFPAADDWTVFRDGTVAIVRVSDYHVEVIPPAGRRLVGRPVPFTPVRVTEADKQQWRDARKNNVPIVRSFGDGGGRAATAPPPQSLAAQEPDAWPATKPPFLGNAAFAAPNGDTWVARARSATDKVPTADVFNPQGQLVGRVVFPERTRLVALGAKGVYLVRIDDDDLQYLQHHALQWTGCTPELKESCGR
jgi:hypothetical protein